MLVILANEVVDLTANELRYRLQNAVTYATNEMKRGLPDQALPFYSDAIIYLSRMPWIGHIPGGAFSLLSNEDTRIPADAAACAVAAGKLERALELLEEGRCVFWGQALNLRTPTAALRVLDPDLANQLEDVAGQIESGVPQGMARYTLAEEYDRLVLAARKHIPDFAQSPTFAQLAHRLQGKTVAVLVASQYGCFALVIRYQDAQIDHIPLPLITWSEAYKMGRSLKDALLTAGRDFRDAEASERHLRLRSNLRTDVNIVIQGILATLWSAVVSPILSHLGIEPCAPDKVPSTRLWWCPTGPFAFLPIHAAGIFTHPVQCSLDYVVSSYTPKLSVMPLDDFPTPLPISLLTLGEVDTPGQAPLPEVEQELQEVQTLAEEHADGSVRRYRLGLGPSALERRRTVENILRRMSAMEIVHVASHASQDLLDPLSSAIYFPSCPLSITQLWRSKTRKPRLMVLSACQTAAGARDLPNEAIHLVGTLLFAGVSSVVGTMWSILDADGPAFASAFYRQLFQREVVDLKHVAEAVHVAVQTLRGQGLPFSRWVPFLHMGN